MIKRVFLFLLTNILVLITISIVLQLLGANRWMTASGIDYGTLAVFCLVWGMVGAGVSLLMSRWVAKRLMNIKLISPTSAGELGWLYNMVSQVSQAAGLPRVPEIGVYESPEVNAFATGPTKKRALVAFSSGLISRMNRNEIEGVAAHEISHIQNGDMVTMTLLQGVINAFVMFLARVIGFAVSQTSRGENNRTMQMLVTFALDILLGILGSLVVLWYSRRREFRADAGSAKLVGRDKMIAALENLGRYKELGQLTPAHASLNTLKISGGERSWIRLMMSHPPIAERIEALRAGG